MIGQAPTIGVYREKQPILAASDDPMLAARRHPFLE
jgi:hypothetical protein